MFSPVMPTISAPIIGLCLLLTCFVQTAAEDFVLLSVYKEDAIYKAPLTSDTSFNFTRIQVMGIDGPRAIKYDPVDEKIYWVEWVNKKIARCDLDGSNPEDVVTGLGQPWGMDLDIKNRIVYYADYTGDEIHYIGMNLTGQGTIPNTVVGSTNPRDIAFGHVTQYVYAGYSSGSVEIKRYSRDGTTHETLIGPDADIQKVSGLYVDECAKQLFWSDVTLDKVEMYDLETGNRTVLFQGTSGNDIRGMAEYNGYLYWADYQKDGVYRIAIDGSESVATEVITTYDVGSANQASDIYFYTSDKPAGIGGCGAIIDFDTSSIGPVCQGATISVNLTNTGDIRGAINLTATDGTAIGGSDFPQKTEELSIAVGETVTATIDTFGNATNNETEESFFLVLASDDPKLTSNNDMVMVTIASDSMCYYGLTPVITIKKWFGGFIGKLMISIKKDLTDWRLVLHFVRGVWDLELRDCDADIANVEREPGSRRTTYTLIPGFKGTPDMREGDNLFVKFIAKTNDKVRGMPVTAEFIPSY